MGRLGMLVHDAVETGADLPAHTVHVHCARDQMAELVGRQANAPAEVLGLERYRSRIGMLSGRGSPSSVAVVPLSVP